MSPDPTSDATPPRRLEPEEVSFGVELRRERELRGIDLREVAAATKVSRRFLEALERNDFDALPGGLFTKGFIRAYAVHIGADPDRLVNAYLHQLAREGETGGPAPGPRLDPSPVTPARRGRGGLAFLVLALLVALPVGVSLLWPVLRSQPAPAAPPPPEARPAEPIVRRTLEIVATAPGRLQIRCAGETRLDRELAAGERVVLSCAVPVALSSPSGSGLDLWVDGVQVALPAGAGEALEDWEPQPQEPPA